MKADKFSAVSVRPKGKPRGRSFKKGVSGNPRGKPKGTPNRLTADLKQAILLAAQEAGGTGGTVAYLRARAIDTPGPFLALLGKVLPMQIAGTDPDGNPTRFVIDVVYPTSE